MSLTTIINISSLKASTEAQFRAAIDGVNTLLTDLTVVYVNGRPVSRADLLQILGNRISAAEATKAARLGLHKAIENEQAVDAEARPARSALKLVVQSRYGKNSPQVQSFGFSQNKRPKTPAATKAAAVEKSKATRTARHTMGPKQKASIKGTVDSPADTTDESTTPLPATAPATSQTAAAASDVATPTAPPPATHS
jgi:hypothetical protein